jgi:hypothetical protein
MHIWPIRNANNSSIRHCKYRYYWQSIFDKYDTKMRQYITFTEEDPSWLTQVWELSLQVQNFIRKRIFSDPIILQGIDEFRRLKEKKWFRPIPISAELIKKRLSGLSLNIFRKGITFAPSIYLVGDVEEHTDGLDGLLECDRVDRWLLIPMELPYRKSLSIAWHGEAPLSEWGIYILDHYRAHSFRVAEEQIDYPSIFISATVDIP